VLDLVKDWRLHRKTLVIVAQEIGSLALQMSLFLAVRNSAHSPDNPMTQKPSFDTERFDYAYEKDRVTLYQLPSWDSLKRFYGEIKKTQEMKSLTDDQVARLVMEFGLLSSRASDGLLGRQLKSLLIDNEFSHLPKVALQYKNDRDRK